MRLVVIYAIWLNLFIFSVNADDSKAIQAAKGGSVADVQSLIDQGMPIDQRLGEFQNTLLQLAVMYQNVDVVRLLIERGADPSAADSTGFSTYEYLEVLERRAGENREKAIANLRQQGLSESIIQDNYPEIDANGRDFTARGNAIWEKIREMLPAKKNNVQEETRIENISNDAERLNQYFGSLENSNAIIDLQDPKTGETVLIRAVKIKPSPEVIKILLKYGANPSISDQSGKSALDYAASIENESLRRNIQALLTQNDSSQIGNGDAANRNVKTPDAKIPMPTVAVSEPLQPMSSPRDVNEDRRSEFGLLIVPVTIITAIVVAVILFLVRRKLP